MERCYQQTKNFDKLSFLYLTTGSTVKLSKMQKIADARGDPMSRFHNALYAGDLDSRIAVLRDVGLREHRPFTSQAVQILTGTFKILWRILPRKPMVLRTLPRRSWRLPVFPRRTSKTLLSLPDRLWRHRRLSPTLRLSAGPPCLLERAFSNGLSPTVWRLVRNHPT